MTLGSLSTDDLPGKPSWAVPGHSMTILLWGQTTAALTGCCAVGERFPSPAVWHLAIGRQPLIGDASASSW
ncbi:hypothetical protein E2C01_070932 [Portunus trituberculatus]|uniref:Uncharacterized protein n=1 Tax=Portunus trituberculatus TaxID=210409 RepID=A0A5B7I4X7_PORTR|nr:hypothetical protein [Portunus trituberculatus]